MRRNCPIEQNRSQMHSGIIAAHKRISRSGLRTHPRSATIAINVSQNSRNVFPRPPGSQLDRFAVCLWKLWRNCPAGAILGSLGHHFTTQHPYLPTHSTVLFQCTCKRSPDQETIAARQFWAHIISSDPTPCASRHVQSQNGHMRKNCIALHAHVKCEPDPPKTPLVILSMQNQ